MPEGPSIYLFREELMQFAGRKVTAAAGNVKTFDPGMLKGKKLQEIKTWGKHLLLCFEHVTLRIHFLMFGTYAINDPKDKPVRLELSFGRGKTVYFYNTAIKTIGEPLDEVYDWSADVMNESWDSKAALKKLRKMPDELVCDALLDQDIFSGVGNIIKNEVLFRIRVHPESKVGALPAAKLREMVKEAVNYTFQFLEWKREFTLRQHWLAHNKQVCPRDRIRYTKAYPGVRKRRSFYCEQCQVLYR